MITFADPENNIKQFGLKEGEYVADLGAGSGFYTFAAAKIVGEKGRVYAVEVMKELVQTLKNQASEKRLHNIEVVWGDIEELNGTKLRDHVADVVILSNILFQVEDKLGLINESKRILKPKGRVFIVDWTGPHGGVGPEESAVITAQEARDLFESNGFVFEGDIEAGTHHYGFSVSKI